MGLNNCAGTLLHRLDNADFSKYVYFSINATGAATVTVNGGDPMPLIAGSEIHMVINDITSTADTNIFLVGTIKPFAATGSFDVRTGLPS